MAVTGKKLRRINRKRKGLLGGIKDVFSRSSKKKREIQAKKDLKAEGTYGKRTELAQKKMDGGARRSYNKMVRKTNKAIEKNNECIQDPRMPKEKMEKLKRGTMSTYEKTTKLSRKDRKAQVSNRAKADYEKKKKQNKAIRGHNRRVADMKKKLESEAAAKNKAASDTKKANEAAALKKKQTADAEAKFKASGGFSKARVKVGQYSKTLKKSEIPAHNKKLKREALEAAKRKNPKGGTFQYTRFDADGNKQTVGVRYGNAMSKKKEKK